MEQVVDIEPALLRRAIFPGLKAAGLSDGKGEEAEVVAKVNVLAVDTLEKGLFGAPVEEQTPGIIAFIDGDRFVGTHELMGYLVDTGAILLDVNAYRRRAEDYYHITAGMGDADVKRRNLTLKRRTLLREGRTFSQIGLAAGKVRNLSLTAQELKEQSTGCQPFELSMRRTKATFGLINHRSRKKRTKVIQGL